MSITINRLMFSFMTAFFAVSAYGGTLQVTAGGGYSIAGDWTSATFLPITLKNTSATTTTGTLRLELWLTKEKYAGLPAPISGWRIATHQLAGATNGTLAPNQSISTNANVTVSIDLATLPATGAYYVSLLITEYTANSCPSNGNFCLALALNSPNLAYVGTRPTVIEFYNTTLDNYFITADPNEATAIDNGAAGPGWSRTGNTFKWGGSTFVCRFYGSQRPGPNSHFYTVDPGECQSLKNQQFSAGDPRRMTTKSWNFESLDFVSTPATTGGINGTCPTGTVPVYRAYNNGFARGIDSNHRITTSLAAIQAVVARGWSNEGVVMCTPPGGTAPTCTYELSELIGSAPASGGSGSVSVTAAAGCAWSATSNSSWITITGGANGSGNGTVSYSTSANPSSGLRAGSLTIAGQIYTVLQD